MRSNKRNLEANVEEEIEQEVHEKNLDEVSVEIGRLFHQTIHKPRLIKHRVHLKNT